MRRLVRCRRPTHRLPTIGRILHKQSSYNCDDQISDPEISECAQDADALNESRSHRRGNERAGAKPANRNPGNESSAIWKPLHQHGHWNDVAKAKANSADHTIRQVKPRQSMSEAGEKNSQPIERTTGQRDHARSFAVQPQAAEKCSKAQDKDADRKC